MSSNKIPLEHKCSKCKKDLRIEKEFFGCECDRYHCNSGKQTKKSFIDYDAYDGYGYWDYVEYLIGR